MSPNTLLLRSLGMDTTNFLRDFMKNSPFKIHSFWEEKGMAGISGISGKV